MYEQDVQLELSLDELETSVQVQQLMKQGPCMLFKLLDFMHGLPR